MDAGLIENWNKVVESGDEVYILGDFTLRTGTSYIQNILNSLNGNKHLILGNHDYFAKRNWAKEYFKSITPYKEIFDNDTKVILCHYPIQVWNHQDEGGIHLYGHIHSNLELKNPHPDTINVGCDVHNYIPQTLDQLIQNPWEERLI